MTAPRRPDRILVVMRHAKSSWSTGLPDHQRPLSGRGRRDGVAAGEWLAHRGQVPELTLVSTSERTRQTLARAQRGGAEFGRVEFAAALYAGDEHDLLELIRATGRSVRRLLLIGHNPALESLIYLLARRVGNPDWWAAMDVKFPTSAIAEIGFDGDWSDVEPGVGALMAYAVPRG
ncbi:MAG: histidine phosphatase family protein [Propionibacteriaceae bacterium]|nr:histidine phosphatase family protein [Propionibacteriaceae bacterium]